MDKKIVRLAKKTFQLQEESKDCGSACLASILQFYGSNFSITEINELSGTNTNGTTILGLHNACNELNLSSEALRATSIDNLEELKGPAILHVVINENLYHFIVYYGKVSIDKHLIGNPEKGVFTISDAELENIWKSKILLTVSLTDLFRLDDSNRPKKNKVFIDFLKSQRKVLYISIFLGLIISTISLSTAIFYQHFIDKILPSKNMEKLTVAFLSLTFLLISNSILGYMREIVIYRQSQNLNKRIFSDFFENLIYLPKSFFEKKKIGDLTSRLMDIHQIDVFFTQALGNAVINALLIVIFIGFIFTKSSTSAIILTVSIPSIFFISKYFIGEIIQSQKEVLSTYGNTESFFYDIVKGIDTIKSYTKEKHFFSAMFGTYNRFQQSSFALNKTESFFNLSVGFILILSSMSIVFLTSIQVLSSQLKLGEMLAIIFLSSSVINAANGFIPIYMLYKKVDISINRITDQLMLRTDREKSHSQTSFFIQKIEIENLSFGFVGHENIIRNINFIATKGETILIQGDIGSGKSLLFSLLLKMYDNASGKVIVVTNKAENTFSWNQISKSEWRNLFAIVPQEIAIFNGSVLENIIMDNVESPEEQQRALNIYNIVLKTASANFPEGPFTLIGQGGIKLSGGQAKLLGLARALFKNSQVLLLDELTAGMDATTERYTLDLLNELKENFITLFITHNPPTNFSFDSEYFLDRGELTTLTHDLRN
ncbi:MAG TPA: ABC transporter transmembrane domain-containing protein [Cyclobacteriaceae bacterium]